MNATDQNVTHENNQDDDEEVPTSPIWLKVIVTVLGVAIVAMLLLIVFKIANGDHQRADQPVGALPASGVGAVSAMPPATALGAADYDIPRPEGGMLVSITPSGVELFMRFQMGDGTQKIIILNRETGALSTITIS